MDIDNRIEIWYKSGYFVIQNHRLTRRNKSDLLRLKMKYKLNDIFDLQMGKTPSRNNGDYWNSKEYKWISIADLTKTGKYISNTKEYLSKVAVEESGINVIPANTVIMSFKLSIGKTAITAEDMYSNEAIMAFHDKHIVEILPEYIFYLFKYRNWDTGSNKAVMGKTLNKATLSGVEIEICSIEKQRKIVRNLDKIMGILERREKELELLQDFVKARFVEMFGDPVANDKRWDTLSLENACKTIIDCPHSTPSYTHENTGFMCIRTSIVKKNRILWDDIEYIPEDEFEKRIQRKKPTVGDIVYTREGAILGIAAIIDRNYNVALGQRSMLLSPDTDKCASEFLCVAMNSDSFLDNVLKGVSGSASPHINVGDIKAFKMIMPPVELQNQFAEFVQAVDKLKLLSLILRIHIPYFCSKCYD